MYCQCWWDSEYGWECFTTSNRIPTRGGSSKKNSHVYFLLIVTMVLLLWHHIILLWHQVTMVVSEQHLYQTIVLSRKLATGSIHDYLFATAPSGFSICHTENWLHEQDGQCVKSLLLLDVTSSYHKFLYQNKS